MIPKKCSLPDLGAASIKHQLARQEKDYFYNQVSQHYNIIDQFKGLSIAEIKQQLQQTAVPFAVCFENWIGCLNLATGFRNANAFNFREVFYLGWRKFDRRGLLGVNNYTDIQYLSTLEQFKDLKKRYKIVAIENSPGSISINKYRFQPESLFIFGEEGCGLTPEMLALADDVVNIPQLGSVRSLNCSVASGIVMHAAVASLE